MSAIEVSLDRQLLGLGIQVSKRHIRGVMPPAQLLFSFQTPLGWPIALWNNSYLSATPMPCLILLSMFEMERSRTNRHF